MQKSMQELAREFEAVDQTSPEALTSFAATYAADERKGVIRLCTKALKLAEAMEKELARTARMYSFEDKFRAEGYRYICGIDEVGRGPLAGPVVTCAVILPAEERLLYLNDSKQVRKEKREELYQVILEKAVSIGIGICSAQEIDRINILEATYQAMRQSVEKLSPAPDLLLVDAVKIPGIATRQIPIIKGDTLSASIAAASIFAKVTRDRMMEEFDARYPGYGFSKNAGYGTAEHMEALRSLGLSPIHRTTFVHL